MSPSSPFEIRAPARILFGRGVFSQAAECAASMGRRALVVTGPSALDARAARPPGPGTVRRLDRSDTSRDREGIRPTTGTPARSTEGGWSPPGNLEAGGPLPLFASLAGGLRAGGVGVVHFLVRGEPTTVTADEGARLALASGCDVVIGLGGGSVLDAAKAVSGLSTNGGTALDYLELVGRGCALQGPAAPFIAIPTTAGTGSEATKNAVLKDPRSRVKASLRSPYLMPTVAIVDPDLTLSLPPALTASTGLDALTQLIEAYITPRANAMTDLFALAGIERSARSLLAAVENGADAAAREDLAFASLLGGLALANAALGAVHGVAAALGGRFSVPHGVACAILLPHVLATNLSALRRLDPAGPALHRMARVGELLARAYRLPGGETAEDRTEEEPADTAVRLTSDLVTRCRLGRLAAYGVTRADLPDLAAASLRASSMRGNPAPLTTEAIVSAIGAAL